MSVAVIEEEFQGPVIPEESEYDRQLAAAYALTPSEFLSLKVADRDLAVFLLLREIAGTVRSLELRINEYEKKGQELASPEGLQKVMDKFIGGNSGLGGMLGMFR